MSGPETRSQDSRPDRPGYTAWDDLDGAKELEKAKSLARAKELEKAEGLDRVLAEILQSESARNHAEMERIMARSGLDLESDSESSLDLASDLASASELSSEQDRRSEALSDYEKSVSLEQEYLMNAAEMNRILRESGVDFDSDGDSAPEPTEPAAAPTPATPETTEVPEDSAFRQSLESLKGDRPLTAIVADWSHDRKELAHDLAEQALNAETAKGKLIDRIWKGTIFKKYYEKKYENEFLEGKRTTADGKTVRDLIREQSSVTIERFVLGATEDMRYIHQHIGKKNKDGVYEDGEKLVEADEKTNQAIKSAIESYARRHATAGENLEDLNREFKDELARIFAVKEDDVREHRASERGIKETNFLAIAREAAARYEAVAINARTKAEQDLAMSAVMAGFKVYNADVRNNVRTDAHRDAIDKIVNKLESSKIGQFIPGEVIAGALGAATALTQTGARAIAGAAGGIIASSAISGLKERNRITEERARMLRDVAMGKAYTGQSEEDIKNLRGAAKKIAKHEANIGGTLYDMRNATDLTKGIEEAMNYDGEDRSTRLLQAIAEARVRINFSDSQQKDLISYSSSDACGKERLALDIAVIRAEKSLSDADKATLKTMKREIKQRIIKGYEDESGEYHAGVMEQDQEFKAYRALAAMKKAGKTLALGSLFFLGSQEVSAALDPAKIGIFEKYGLIKTENAADAKETLLASGFGLNRGSYIHTTPSTEEIKDVSDPELVKQYEQAGFKKVKVKEAWSEPNNRYEDVDVASSPSRVNVKYDGWAHNGTKIADGNELRAHIENGKFISDMHGTSTYNGGTVNYDTANVKAFITVGNSKFEVVGSTDAAGHLTWGENGIFTTTGGETIKAIGDNGERLYKYFEIAADNGVDAEGIQHIIPLATDVGNNTFSGTFRQVIENTVTHPPVYNFVKEVANAETFVRDVTTSGLVITPPDLLRTGIGAAYQREQAPTAPEPAPVTPETPAEPTPEAPETSPEPISAPESQPTAPAPEPTPEAASEALTDFERWNDSILEGLYDNAELAGGEEGIDVLTDMTPLSSESQSRYQAWWTSLSDESQNYVRDFVNTIQSSDYQYSLNWGSGFRTWFALNGYN